MIWNMFTKLGTNVKVSKLYMNFIILILLFNFITTTEIVSLTNNVIT